MIDSLLEKIKKNQCQGDIYYQENQSYSLIFENNRFKTNESSWMQGVGLRIINPQGCEGFTYGNQIEDSLFEKAKALSSFGEKVDYHFPANGAFPLLSYYDPSILDLSSESLLEKGESIISEITRIYPSFQTSLQFQWGKKKNHLANTSDFWQSYEKTFFSCSLSILKAENDEILEIGEYFSTPFYAQDSLDRLKNNILELSQYSQKNAKIGRGKYPVLFTPKAMRSFIDILLNGWNGKWIEKKISPILDKIGKIIASSSFSLIDDGISQELSGSSPFDSEGIASQQNYLIQNGVCLDGIYDLKIASRLNKKPTGNGLRAYSSLPTPSFRNTIVLPGNTPYRQMLDSLSYGILADQFLGAGMSNVLAGEFSANLDLGFLVKNGVIQGRLKNTMISGNVFDMIQKILAISEEQISYGSYRMPFILFDSIEVSS